MSVAKSIELSAESTESFDAAIREGIKTANKTIDNLESVWIKDQEVRIGTNGSPMTYKVWMRATFEVN